MADLKLKSDNLNGNAELLCQYEYIKSLCVGGSNLTHKQWMQEDEFDLAFYSVIKSWAFWFSQLKESSLKNSLLFTMYNLKGDSTPTILQIITFIHNQFTLEDILGYSETKHSSYFVLDFKSEEKRNLMMTRLKIMGNSIFIPADWTSNKKLMPFKIEWLPRIVTLKDINDTLKDYLNIQEIKKVETKITNTIFLQSGKVRGIAILQKDISLLQVPYIIDIAGYKGILHLHNRPPICYNCLNIGHTKLTCDGLYCKKCRKKHRKSSYCDLHLQPQEIPHTTKSTINSNSLADTNQILHLVQTNGKIKNDYGQSKNLLESQDNIKTTYCYKKKQSKNLFYIGDSKASSQEQQPNSKKKMQNDCVELHELGNLKDNSFKSGNVDFTQFSENIKHVKISAQDDFGSVLSGEVNKQIKFSNASNNNLSKDFIREISKFSEIISPIATMSDGVGNLNSNKTKSELDDIIENIQSQLSSSILPSMEDPYNLKTELYSSEQQESLSTIKTKNIYGNKKVKKKKKKSGVC